MARGVEIGRGYIRIDLDEAVAHAALRRFTRTATKAFSAVNAAAVSAGVGAGAAVGGIGAAFAALGVIAASSSAEVRSAFSDLWGEIASGAQDAAGTLEPVLVDIANRFSGLNRDLQPQLKEMFAAAGPALSELASGVENLARTVMPALAEATRGQLPVFSAFRSLIENVGEGFATFIRTVSGETGAAARSIQAFGDIARTALELAGNIIAKMAGQGAPLMERLAEVFRQAADVVSRMADGALPVLASAASVALDVLSALMNVLGPLSSQLGVLIGVALTASTAFRIFGPLAKGVTAAGVGIAGLGASAERAAGTTTGLSSAGKGLGSALSNVGTKLPIIGAGVAVFSTLVEAAGKNSLFAAERLNSFADAIVRGGKGAAEAQRNLHIAEDIAKIEKGFGTLTLGMDVYGKQVDKTTTSIRNQIAALTPLEAAQRDVANAQVAYDTAVKQFGPTSLQAITAQQTLASATTRLGDAQQQAAAATKDHTRSIAEQAEQALAAASADLGYRQAISQVRDAQQQAAEATRQHGAASREAESAQQNLELAMIRAITAAREKALADNAGRSATDQARAANAAMSQTLQTLANDSSPQAQAALRNIVGSMNGTQLAAFGAKAGIDAAGHAVAVLPNGKTIPITADVAQALRDAARINSALDVAARHRVATIEARIAKGMPAISDTKLRAIGGPIAAKQPYIVGERGPELIFPDRSGYVATAAQTRGVLGGLSGRGDATVNQYNTFSPGLSEQSVADIAAQSLGWELRRLA